MMQTKILLVLLVALGWNCKENPDRAKQKIMEVQQEVQTVTSLPASIKEIVQFVTPTFTDTTDIHELFIFKELNADGSVSTVAMDRAGDLYNKLAKRQKAISLPIFEIKNTDLAVLPIQGVGFGGAIWAKVLLDTKTLEIKKTAFEHKAESEGYGAAITQQTFEDRFAGKKINLKENNFILQKAMEKVADDGHIIDGISGATMTSQGAVKMVNEGLRKYRDYLEGE